jgi:aryl-alcohol dehydrogenase-like predicted oxidoreductase
MVERIALGGGPFGGLGSNPQYFGQGTSEEDAFALMDAAWELGIRWLDTADAYGGGRSETMIGNWLRASARRPRVTTKTFNPMDTGEDRGLERERILRQNARSLERLGLERVDLYLAHDFDPETPLEETVAAFEELAAAGRIGAYGFSNFDAEQLAAALEAGARPAYVQNSCSLLDRGDEREVLPLCRERGIAYQAYSPLAGGWLTGKYRRGEAPPEGSRMTLLPGPYRHLDDDRVYDALGELAAFAAERGVGMAAVALVWLLGNPLVDSIVVGPARPEHLDCVAEALKLELSPADRDRVGSLFEWQS